MRAPSSRAGGGRGAVVGAVGAAAIVGVVALALYELATGGSFYAERGGGSATLVAQFVLLALPMAAVAAAVLVPIGIAVGWVLGRR